MEQVIPMLDMRGIDKHFPGTHALKNVDFSLNTGEILGLVGENGAGKSTLVKILSGAHQMDSGDIFINGQRVEIQSTGKAQQFGIGIIYQELNLFPHMNAMENIFIHQENTKGIFLDRKTMRKRAEEILLSLNVSIDVLQPVRTLRMAEQQLVEIARALVMDNRIIIMDEPTASLEDAEKSFLFRVIRHLKETGVSIIFVSHHLDEIMEISDRTAVLRDGVKVLDRPTSELTMEGIIDAMIGRSVEMQYPKEIVPIGETVLEVKELALEDVFHVSFALHKGEILGIAGLAGSGKIEIGRVLFGACKATGGQIFLHGQPVQINRVHDAVKRRIALLPAERKTEGLFLAQSIRWNISISALQRILKGLLSRRKDTDFARKYVEEMRIKTSSVEHPAKSLSGGNQQKVMLGRWMMTEPDILILEEPTRGIDISAKTEVYRLMMNCVKQGESIIMISSESPELLGICDRILIVHEGEIIKDAPAKEISEAQLARYAQGRKEN